MNTPEVRRVSGTAVRRLSRYLRILDALSLEGHRTVSSEVVAERGGTTAAQVRKDLSLFGSFGKRGTGYPVGPLAEGLREILGVNRRRRVALIGAGRIGSALFEYEDFRRRGFDLIAIFDADPEKIGRRWKGTEIRGMAALEEGLEEDGIEIVVLAVPGEPAQELLDRVVAAGIRAVLNFAPVRLLFPEGVTVNDVDLATELEILAHALPVGEEEERGAR